MSAFHAALGQARSRTKRPPLVEFLKSPAKPLSARAAAGFLGRTKKASLRSPPGFLEALEAYLERNLAREAAEAAEAEERDGAVSNSA